MDQIDKPWNQASNDKYVIQSETAWIGASKAGKTAHPNPAGAYISQDESPVSPDHNQLSGQQSRAPRSKLPTNSCNGLRNALQGFKKGQRTTPPTINSTASKKTVSLNAVKCSPTAERTAPSSAAPPASAPVTPFPNSQLNSKQEDCFITGDQA